MWEKKCHWKITKIKFSILCAPKIKTKFDLKFYEWSYAQATPSLFIPYNEILTIAKIDIDIIIAAESHPTNVLHTRNRKIATDFLK